MKDKKYGKCHLCGNVTELTFEHLPPEKAHNDRAARVITGDVLSKHIAGVKKPWDYSGERYKNMQRGMGGYTLCSNCNNNTGAWYAQEYVKFANTIGIILNTKVNIEKSDWLQVSLIDAHPLRIMKQILCMFASTMPPEFLDANPDLREFILNKYSRNFDVKKYRISMYFLKTLSNGWSGLTGMLRSSETRLVAYMDLYPLGFVLEIDPKGENFKNTLDITSLATNCEYDTKCTLELCSNILERNNFFPADFRTKDEIEMCIENNKKETMQSTIKEMKMLEIAKEEYYNIIEEYKNNKISCGEFTMQIEALKAKKKGVTSC
ncbi:MAG: hypothetical protein IKK43_01825 [Clostridia bacterium]|nr:hypothetical protein [Clostridia bacterium]